MLPGFSQNASHESLEVQPPGPLPPSRSNSRACPAPGTLIRTWLSANATHAFIFARSSQYERHSLLLPQLPSSGTGNVIVDSCALTSAAERMKSAPSTIAPKVRTAVSFASCVILLKRIFVIRERIRLGQLVCRGLHGSPDLGRDIGSGIYLGDWLALLCRNKEEVRGGGNDEYEHERPAYHQRQIGASREIHARNCTIGRATLARYPPSIPMQFSLQHFAKRLNIPVLQERVLWETLIFFIIFLLKR